MSAVHSYYSRTTTDWLVISFESVVYDDLKNTACARRTGPLVRVFPNPQINLFARSRSKNHFSARVAAAAPLKEEFPNCYCPDSWKTCLPSATRMVEGDDCNLHPAGKSTGQRRASPILKFRPCYFLSHWAVSNEVFGSHNPELGSIIETSVGISCQFSRPIDRLPFRAACYFY